MSNWNLDVTADLAERVEERLREFARDAELDLSLLVDDSGAMIAGVASRPDVDVATVGALVAGAFGAVRGLSRELGDTQSRDCVCHGSDNNIYLRSVVGRFVLLGVSEVSLPIGVIREKAAQITGALDELLAAYRPTPVPEASSEAIEEPAPAEFVPDPVTENVPAPASDGASPASPKKKPSDYVFEIG